MAQANDSVLVTPGSGATIASHLINGKEYQVVMVAEADGHLRRWRRQGEGPIQPHRERGNHHPIGQSGDGGPGKKVSATAFESKPLIA